MEAFEALLMPCQGSLERYVKFHIDNLQDAEDIIQETLLAAFRGFDSLKQQEKFKAWLLTIARNKCRDYYRRKKAPETDLEAVENLLTQAEPAPVEAVAETLSGLRDHDRQLLEMTYYEAMSQQEIARRLNIPLGTVKSRMYAAKQSFRTAYPYPPRMKGDFTMKHMPERMPEYTITPSKEAPFSVKYEELPGWTIIPREGEKCRWAMYGFPYKNRLMYADMEVLGAVQIHGLTGVEILAQEYQPVPSERVDAQDPVERHLFAQLTDTHCRILAESHKKQGVQEYYTFLDGDAFTKNWGFGPDNQGNPVNIKPQGSLEKNGSVVTMEDQPWPVDIVGRYTVTIGGRAYDTVLILDVECYDNGMVLENYVDKNGRSVLWRRFNRDDWAYDHFKELWTDKLPENERMTVNGVTYVHWYDCISDYIM